MAVLLLSLTGAVGAGQAHDAAAARAEPPAAAPRAGDDWPQLLGPRRDGVVADDELRRDWPQEGLPVLWRLPVGSGFAGPVVSGRRVLLFQRVENEEMVAALDDESGQPYWTISYPTSYRDDFGFDEGPRSPPTVADGKVFTFGAQGVLQALDLETGELLWRVNTHDAFDVRKGFFGAACAPLVHDGVVMVNVGGDDAGIVGFDAATGQVRWRVTDHEASYSSPVLTSFGDVAAVLFFTREGLVELDPASGELRRQFRWRSRSRSSVNAASPLVLDGRVFLSAGYRTGAALLERTESGFEPVWSNDESLSTHYATAVHLDGTLYGFHGELHVGPPNLRAVDLATGTVRWSQPRFGGGSIIGVGERLLIVRDNGELVVAAATPESLQAQARYRILSSTVRALPALARGVLYVRDERELIAVNLRP